jgi:hypothetical protein
MTFVAVDARFSRASSELGRWLIHVILRVDENPADDADDPFVRQSLRPGRIDLKFRRLGHSRLHQHRLLPCRRNETYHGNPASDAWHPRLPGWLALIADHGERCLSPNVLTGCLSRRLAFFG